MLCEQKTHHQQSRLLFDFSTIFITKSFSHHYWILLYYHWYTIITFTTSSGHHRSKNCNYPNWGYERKKERHKFVSATCHVRVPFYRRDPIILNCVFPGKIQVGELRHQSLDNIYAEKSSVPNSKLTECRIWVTMNLYHCKAFTIV